MAQPYFGGGEYETAYRPYPRAASTARHYDQPIPYPYHDHHRTHHYRPHSPAGQFTRNDGIPINEPGNIADKARKRISVACGRCRKRKIKCSGDQQDGMGCTACRAVGQDGSTCNFMRVGSSELRYQSGELSPIYTPAPFNSQSDPYTVDNAPAVYSTTTCEPHSGLAVPILQTRSSFSLDYGQQYNISPVDGYYGLATSAIPRQDSVTNVYGHGLDNYRSCWQTSSHAPPQTSTYCEQPQTMYTFGSLQTPAFPQMQHHSNRLPSITAESASALNMSHLNSSLPPQNAQTRRLPNPFAQGPSQVQYQPRQLSMPNIRPLDTIPDHKVHINGIHSRSAMSWSIDGTGRSRRDPAFNHSSPRRPSPGRTQNGENTTAPPGSVPIYHFNFSAPDTSPSSPNVSPTSGSSANDNLSNTSSSANTSYLPSTTYRIPSSVPNGYELPPMLTNDGPATTSDTIPTRSLFSYSSEASERQAAADDQAHQDSSVIYRGHDSFSMPAHRHQSQRDSNFGNYLPRRISTYDQEALQHASTAQRMSVSNLSSHS